MNRAPRKTLREYVKGLPVWQRIIWIIALGYIIGRVVYFLRKLLIS